MAAEWTEIIAPVSLDAWHKALAEWRTAHDPDADLADDDLRIDVIRTTGGDQIRVLVRSSALAAIAPQAR